MASMLKSISVVMLVLGFIASIIVANIGPEFSFVIFITFACVNFIYFLLMYGIGSIWERQDVIESEHAEILRMLRGSDPKTEKENKKIFASFEKRQIEILNLLKSSSSNTDDSNLSIAANIQEVVTPEKVQEDLPRAVVVERTYDDIKKRKASEGWKCKKCGKNNIMSRRTCIECGEPR